MQLCTTAGLTTSFGGLPRPRFVAQQPSNDLQILRARTSSPLEPFATMGLTDLHGPTQLQNLYILLLSAFSSPAVFSGKELL